MIDEFIELLLCELYDRYSLESHCRHRFFYEIYLFALTVKDSTKLCDSLHRNRQL